MKITWLGTASLLIESGGHKLLFDPYLRKLNKSLPPFPFDKITGAEAIFITHPHLDHYGDMPTVLEHTDCPVYTNARGVQIAQNLHFYSERIRPIQFGDVLTFGELTIQAYRSRHVEFDKQVARSVIKRVLKGRIITGIKLNSLNNRMTIDLTEDVFAFCLRYRNNTALILGSANIDENTEYPKADILIYPYQGRGDMLEYSLRLVKALSPATVILDHFDDAFPPLTTRMNVEEFKSRLESESNIKVIISNESEPIETPFP